MLEHVLKINNENSILNKINYQQVKFISQTVKLCSYVLSRTINKRVKNFFKDFLFCLSTHFFHLKTFVFGWPLSGDPRGNRSSVVFSLNKSIRQKIQGKNCHTACDERLIFKLLADIFKAYTFLTVLAIESDPPKNW